MNAPGERPALLGIAYHLRHVTANALRNARIKFLCRLLKCQSDGQKSAKIHGSDDTGSLTGAKAENAHRHVSSPQPWP
jgi:hypothetical protein